MQQSITFAGILLCISFASAQLSYHLDANTNSYTLQTPNSQQTFTQHFKTHGSSDSQSSPLQAAHSKPEQQIYSTAPQQFSNSQVNSQEEINSYFRQQLELQQQQQQQEQQQQQPQQRQAEPNNVFTPYQAHQQQRQYEQSAQEHNAYYQQNQQAQLQQEALQLQQLQQQQYSLPEQPQFAYQQPSIGYDGDDNINQEATRFSQLQQLKYQQQQQLTAPNRIQYSPSNEVSHVKFSSGDLNYNF